MYIHWLDKPELLILDEPTNGLDPAGVVEIRELLRELAYQDGVTIFMSSHILTEVDRLASRIGIIHWGRLTEELDASRLDQLRGWKLVVRSRLFQRVHDLRDVVPQHIDISRGRRTICQ